MTPPLRRTLGTLLALLLFAVFAALGSWQVKRLFWKLDLIERVNQRVNAPAVAPPQLAGVEPAVAQRLLAENEYRHVRLTGHFLVGRDVQVQAVTQVGSGFWLLSPLQQDGGGGVVWVNRGFVPPRWTPPAPKADSRVAPVTLTGLLRLSEPGGGFLRRNEPAAERWFSRDVAAIAQHRGLQPGVLVAPYFVDAQASPAATAPVVGAATLPVGGLTVVAFHNSHLVYAITWFALALMVPGAAFVVARHNQKSP